MINWRPIPFVRLLIPLLVGLLCGEMLPVLQSPLLCLLGSGFLFMGLISLHLLNQKFYWRWLFGANLFVSLFLLGLQLMYWKADIHQNEHFARLNRQATLYISEVTQVHPVASGSRLRIKVQRSLQDSTWQTTQGNAFLYLKSSSIPQQSIFPGESILFLGTYSPLPKRANPHSFNYTRFLHFQNIHYRFFVPDSLLCQIESPRPGTTVSIALCIGDIRQKALKTLRRALPSEQSFGVGAAMILGHKEDLEVSIKEAYSKTGAMHVLAVSGLHVGRIYIAVSLLFSVLPVSSSRKKWIQALSSLVCIWATGGCPGNCRRSCPGQCP